MKTMLIALVALPTIATAQSAPPAPPRQPAPAAHKAGEPLDPTSFCYVAGQPFSEGARHQGQVCTTPQRVAVNPLGPKPTLRWEADRAAR